MRIFLMLLLLIPTRGYMAQVHFERVSIQEVVKLSDVILVVKKCAPYFDKDSLVHHFEIVRVLKNERRDFRIKNPELKGKMLIDVRDAGYAEVFDENSRQASDPMPQSKTILVYNPKAGNIQVKKEFIVYLTYLTKEAKYRYSVDGGIEDVRHEKNVQKLINQG